MEAYFAMRIKDGKLNYNAVIKKFPQYKEGIDLILIADGYEVLTDGTVKKVNS